MPKSNPTPGTVLNALIQKHGLNYSRLAKAIGISSAMVRLIARDENPVSAPVAFRLAKFFKNKPEYWLALQMDFEISKTAENKKLEKVLRDISTVDKTTFERKPTVKKTAKPVKGKAAAKPAKPAKPAAAKSAGAKPGRPAKAAAKKPVVAKRKPAAAKPPKKERAPAQEKPQATESLFISPFDPMFDESNA